MPILCTLCMLEERTRGAMSLPSVKWWPRRPRLSRTNSRTSGMRGRGTSGWMWVKSPMHPMSRVVVRCDCFRSRIEVEMNGMWYVSIESVCLFLSIVFPSRCETGITAESLMNERSQFWAYSAPFLQKRCNSERTGCSPFYERRWITSSRPVGWRWSHAVLRLWRRRKARNSWRESLLHVRVNCQCGFWLVVHSPVARIPNTPLGNALQSYKQSLITARSFSVDKMSTALLEEDFVYALSTYCTQSPHVVFRNE